MRAFYRNCGDHDDTENSATCACAVAIRSDDDVVVIDRCNSFATDEPRLLDVQLYQNGPLSMATSMTRNGGGLAYEVNLYR